ncbi:MAG: sigma-70 family RNA polymerase sigma factor [Actinobacteria bacterium]|nr:sigma-70 family RNA polymerase sigma factor [Actinomycetota bacterium]
MVAQRADELIYDGPDGEALASADERDLTIAFKSGSEDAYSVIYGRYRPRVESLCRRMLANPHDAQEATQEAFLRVFQSLHSFNGRYQLGAWITRIATNVCLDSLRTQARRPSQPTPMEEMELTLPDQAIDSDPEFFVIRRAESRRVRRVLESLPPMHRAAIILRDFEGLSYSEVAIALGITDAQVKALLHRARTGFKRAWNPAAVASMFLPASFVDRFRKVEHTVTGTAKTATPLADLAAGASQTATSCGGFMQACGVVVTERFATAAAAVVVTAGAVAGVGAPAPEAPSAPTTTIAAVDSATGTPSDSRKTRERRPPKDNGPADAPVVVPTPEPSAPPPPDPTPTPSPTPTTPPPGGGDNPAPAPAPTPFTIEMGTEGSGASPGAPASSAAMLNCYGQRLEHNVSGSFWHNGVAYPAKAYVQISGAVGRMELSIYKDGRNFRYSSWGASPAATWSDSAASLGGAYGPLYGSKPAEAGLPDGGDFTVSLGLHCSKGRLRSESVYLTD